MLPKAIPNYNQCLILSISDDIGIVLTDDAIGRVSLSKGEFAGVSVSDDA